MATDTFSGYINGLTAPVRQGFEITPDDGADLPFVTRAINAGAPGNVRVTLAGGDTVTLFIAAGTILPVRAVRVWATGTDAPSLVGLY